MVVFILCRTRLRNRLRPDNQNIPTQETSWSRFFHSSNKTFPIRFNSSSINLLIHVLIKIWTTLHQNGAYSLSLFNFFLSFCCIKFSRIRVFFLVKDQIDGWYILHEWTQLMFNSSFDYGYWDSNWWMIKLMFYVDCGAWSKFVGCVIQESWMFCIIKKK